MIRVLLADDSELCADILRAILERDPEIRIIGRARDGAEAVELCRRLRPDIMLMDVRMPSMDGIEATAAIMAETPVPILVVSAAVSEDASIAFRAIQAGAIDVVAKPSGALVSDYVRLDLCRHVKLVSRVLPIRRGRPKRVAVATTPTAASAGRVVALGASTGGPAALSSLLGAFPPDFPCPILAVQHIARGFLEGFTTWLASTVKLKVQVGHAGERIQPGRVYFAPEDRHLGLGRDGTLVLSAEEPRDGHRPSVSWLFESVAEASGAKGVGVLLTGMGRDGADGLLRMRQQGARTLCQDASTCVVYGMPRAAVECAAAEQVLPLEALPAAIVASLGLTG